MPEKIVIKDGLLVNQGKCFKGSVLVEGEIIKKIWEGESGLTNLDGIKIINAFGKYILPGVIDDQVHFREPGLAHKGDIATESAAAVAGGVTSYMEMPNTNPQSITQQLLEEKFKIASKKSLANYSFYIGATNNNVEELAKTNPKNVCGIKVFMGASTGNMLVDNPDSLKNIFSKCKQLVAVHCEDESIIQKNATLFRSKYGDNLPINFHPEIRSEEACYKSSSLAVELAKKYGTRLHILHLSTEKELGLFQNCLPSGEKQITSEVCIHHLWFDEKDYDSLGNKIKWNPAIKKSSDKEALLRAVLDDRIDIIATDHAPHTIEEKNNSYFNAPSGGPLVQHSLVAMLELSRKGKISVEKIVEKMCHTPADIFKIDKRGYIKEGYYADLVVVDINDSWKVTKNNILYKCKWSPFEGITFGSKVTHTLVNGHVVFEDSIIYDRIKGKRLEFNR